MAGNIVEALGRWFVYHPPKNSSEVKTYEVIRSGGHEFADTIAALVPSHDSEEFKQAMFHVRAAVMWANAAIACEPTKTDAIPSGLCGAKDPHPPHLHESTSMGHFLCRGVEEI